MADTATLRSRADAITVPGLVGLTIREARNKFRDILNISANAYPTIDGVAVDENHRIEAGETVNFAVAVGEKGVSVTFVL